MTPHLAIEREAGLDLQHGLATEWLETNGLGDYASSTVLFCPTRRYHGLLVARPPGAEKRHVFLSRFEELLRIGADEHELSVTQYGDVFAPRGDRRLSTFALTPHPRATYALGGGVELVREVLLVRGTRTVLVRYALDGAAEATLELRPFLPCRDADALTISNEVAALAPLDDTPRFQPYVELPALTFGASVPFTFEPDPQWYRGVRLAADEARGYPGVEDHPTPGVLRLTLGPDAVVAASLDGPVADPAALWKSEARRRSRRWVAAVDTLGGGDPTPAARLAFTADDFLLRIDGRLGVDAGYPWFGEWGRDTFIALPGLTLARGRLDECADALTQTLAFLDDGLVPNIFGRTRATSHYGSVDASLWYARAVALYEDAGGDAERVLDEYLPALAEIGAAYWDGTGLGVKADDGGLIRAGSPALNATWMDANTPDGPVTPRHGCAVEINALWYALLRHLEVLHERTGDRAAVRRWGARRRTARRSFLERFWLSDDGYLADVWRDGEVDRSVRPNMVLAAALAHSPLTKAQRRGVVERADADLVTSHGLRTLAPDAPGYRGRYEGGPAERDAAYHQGTVWPWLFGFHVEAWLRAGAQVAVRERLRSTWNSIVDELDRAGLGHVSEVFDGDVPRRPGGTIAQAWNTAELLRAHRMLERGSA